jgi:hypothetical protein
MNNGNNKTNLIWFPIVNTFIPVAIIGVSFVCFTVVLVVASWQNYRSVERLRERKELEKKSSLGVGQSSQPAPQSNNKDCKDFEASSKEFIPNNNFLKKRWNYKKHYPYTTRQAKLDVESTRVNSIQKDQIVDEYINSYSASMESKVKDAHWYNWTTSPNETNDNMKKDVLKPDQCNTMECNNDTLEMPPLEEASNENEIVASVSNPERVFEINEERMQSKWKKNLDLKKESEWNIL